MILGSDNGGDSDAGFDVVNENDDVSWLVM